MAHTVRITTTTTENSNVLVLNTGYMLTTPGLLKLTQLILGIITVTLVAWYYDNFALQTAHTFFLLMAVAFLICTTCLLVAIVASWSTGSLIAKTLFVSIRFLKRGRVLVDRGYENHLYIIQIMHVV